MRTSFTTRIKSVIKIFKYLFWGTPVVFKCSLPKSKVEELKENLDKACYHDEGFSVPSAQNVIVDFDVINDK